MTSKHCEEHESLAQTVYTLCGKMDMLLWVNGITAVAVMGAAAKYIFGWG